MERLVVTFDAVRDQVVELAKANEEKARQIATLGQKIADQAEATRLKFEAIEALFARHFSNLLGWSPELVEAQKATAKEVGMSFLDFAEMSYRDRRASEELGILVSADDDLFETQ
jgi:hypothetical protein